MAVSITTNGTITLDIQLRKTILLSNNKNLEINIDLFILSNSFNVSTIGLWTKQHDGCSSGRFSAKNDIESWKKAKPTELIPTEKWESLYYDINQYIEKDLKLACFNLVSNYFEFNQNQNLNQTKKEFINEILDEHLVKDIINK